LSHKEKKGEGCTWCQVKKGTEWGGVQNQRGDDSRNPLKLTFHGGGPKGSKTAGESLPMGGKSNVEKKKWRGGQVGR